MKEDAHIDRIAEAGSQWEAAVRSYVRTWGRPSGDAIVTDEEWRASEAERSARSAYEAARDEYRLHLRGDPHEETPEAGGASDVEGLSDDGLSDDEGPSNDEEPLDDEELPDD